MFIDPNEPRLYSLQVTAEDGNLDFPEAKAFLDSFSISNTNYSPRSKSKFMPSKIQIGFEQVDLSADNKIRYQILSNYRLFQLDFCTEFGILGCRVWGVRNGELGMGNWGIGNLELGRCTSPA